MRFAVLFLALVLLVGAALMVLSIEKPEPAPLAAADTPPGDCRAAMKATPCAQVGADRAFPARVPLPPVVHRVEPVLNAAAKRARVSGKIILDVGIRRDGSVGGVCVVKPLPCGMADAAVAAVRQWRFAPQPHDTVSTVTLHLGRESTTF